MQIFRCIWRRQGQNCSDFEERGTLHAAPHGHAWSCTSISTCRRHEWTSRWPARALLCLSRGSMRSRQLRWRVKIFQRNNNRVCWLVWTGWYHAHVLHMTTQSAISLWLRFDIFDHAFSLCAHTFVQEKIKKQGPFHSVGNLATQLSSLMDSVLWEHLASTSLLYQLLPEIQCVPQFRTRLQNLSSKIYTQAIEHSHFSHRNWSFCADFLITSLRS